MEGNQCRTDGHGAQTIRQSTTTYFFKTNISSPIVCLSITVSIFTKMRILLLLSKEMKVLDKEVRLWDVYTGLESTVKNLLTSLRAINELQNSAVRERHWQQLMNTTKVQQRPRVA